VIVDVGHPFYSQFRDGIRFRAVYSGRNIKAKRELMRLKRKQESDADLIEAPRRVIQHFLGGRFDMVTVPPASADGVPFAEWIGTRVARWLNIDFETVFAPANRKTRCWRGAKLQDYKTELAADVTEQRVLLFDDFGETLLTMTRCLRALQDCKAVGGLILCGV